jgi:antitoxin HicB
MSVAECLGGIGAMSDQLRYTINLRPEPEGGFTVLVPALPEVVTYGADEAEALDMAREAIELALAVRRDEGEEIPSDVAPLTRTLVVSNAA